MVQVQLDVIALSVQCYIVCVWLGEFIKYFQKTKFAYADVHFFFFLEILLAFF